MIYIPLYSVLGNIMFYLFGVIVLSMRTLPRYNQTELMLKY